MEQNQSNQAPEPGINPNASIPNHAKDQSADQTGDFWLDFLNFTSQFATETTQQAQQYLEQVTEASGTIMAGIAENPVLKFLTQTFGQGWLKILLGAVDTEQAQRTVREYQQQHPLETPSEIAHRLMVKKSLQAAGIGLVTNLIPPLAIALFAIDLVATTKLQAELIYEIAAAYGLDLQENSRRGEVLAIFGLSFAGSMALQSGLGFVEILPGIGPLVGASSNAVLLYGLGYAACRFYEAKLQSDIDEKTAQTLEQESRDYWKFAARQQVIMDQILAQMILASYPEKSWSDLVPALEKVLINPGAVKAIAAHLKTPIPLDSLLKELHSDFANPILAQCYRIAHIDGEVTLAEQKILDAIAHQFNLDWKQFDHYSSTTP